MPRLLIVEDHFAQSEILKLIFEDEYEVRTAASAYEALSILTEWEPDVMMTDHAMPGMTGMDLVRTMREQNKIELSGPEPVVGKKIKILFYSACMTKDLIAEARALGITNFIEKPFDLKEIKHAVAKVLTNEYT